MEEVKITSNGNAQTAPAQFDITGDDMKKEIGEWVVASLQKDKIISYLNGQMTAAAVQVQKLAQEAKGKDEEYASIDKDKASLVKSNEKLEEKNRTLGDELTQERKKVSDLNAKLNNELSTVKFMQIDIDKKNGEVVKLQKDVADNAAKIAAKDAEISTIKEKDDEISRLKKEVKALTISSDSKDSEIHELSKSLDKVNASLKASKKKNTNKKKGK